jgi:hypothetical protein
LSELAVVAVTVVEHMALHILLVQVLRAVAVVVHYMLLEPQQLLIMVLSVLAVAVVAVVVTPLLGVVAVAVAGQGTILAVGVVAMAVSLLLMLAILVVLDH